MSFLNLGSRSPCRYQNISTMVDPQANRMHTAKKTFSGRGGNEGKTNELITVTRTTRDVNPPTARLMIRSRAEVSPNRGLLSRPPLVPYVLVVKSSMAASAHTHAQRRPVTSQQRRLLETQRQCSMVAENWPPALTVTGKLMRT